MVNKVTHIKTRTALDRGLHRRENLKSRVRIGFRTDPRGH